MIPGGKTGSVAALTATLATEVTLTGGVNRGPTSGIWVNALVCWKTYITQVNYIKKKGNNTFLKQVFNKSKAI
jgi:hypothetical protein